MFIFRFRHTDQPFSVSGDVISQNGNFFEIYSGEKLIAMVSQLDLLYWSNECGKKQNDGGG